MKAAAPALSSCIEIRRRFMRSVNLEKDYGANIQNGDYIVTPTTRQILRRVSDGLAGASTYRAWTITGPYGVGKSAFAVFLTRLLCAHGEGREAAWKQLQQTDRMLANELSGTSHQRNGSRGMLPILLTARRAAPTVCLLEGINAALPLLRSHHPRTAQKEIETLLRDAERGRNVDSRKVTTLLHSIGSISERAGYSGLLMLVDELGKLLEFAARAPHKGDMFLLQEIAEQASRSGAHPILFMGFLHQSFEDYGQHLDSLSRKEWAKIHGRFDNIPFLEPEEQVVRMIAQAIKWTSGRLPAEVQKRVRQVADQSIEAGVCPDGIREQEFRDICVKTYPLHPVTLVSLPFIFRRFAQNERSLFSYLSSLEPGGFQEFLHTHTLTSTHPGFVRVHDLFDYFTANFGAGLFRQPHARRWLEAADVLDRKEGLSVDEIRLVKTIGVLGALGEFCHLSAQEPIISVAVGDSKKIVTGVRNGLKHLQERSILTHRSFNHTYRIWEGSDVDIDARVAEGERKIRATFSLAASIERYLPPRPVVARRHSFETGAWRYFDLAYTDDPTRIDQNASASAGAAGKILVCLWSSNAQLVEFRRIAESKANPRPDVVFAIPQQIGEIQAVAVELGALRWAWDNTPELRDDRVARREIALRIAESEHFLRRSLNALLDPRKEPVGSDCHWYWNGERKPVRSRVGVSQTLSDVCDALYSKTPRIRNELIARRCLSSAAAAARRNLVERMLFQGDKPLLGIEGYPPERSMYESVLRATGLHREVSPGVWAFSAPAEKGPSHLWASWRKLHDVVFNLQPEPQSLATVFKMLADPPFGIADGLHPVLLCAFMMVHPDETTLYREGTFIPEPGVADFEVLLRRPDLLAIAGSQVAGSRAAVVTRLAKGLGTRPATVPVVKALFRMVKALPEFAWRTSRLSPTTIRLREAFERAKSPERFLFVDVPTALDVPGFPDTEGKNTIVEAFFEKLNAALQEWAKIAPDTIREAKDRLLRACGAEATATGWQRLRDIAATLEPGTVDPALLSFLRRVKEAPHDDAGVSGVVALVSGRPPANWLDADVDRFPELAKALAEPIRKAIARAGVDGGSNDAMAALTPDQRERAKSLAKELGERLDASKKSHSSEIIRAALLLLVDKVARRAGE
jgi:hypothetical protein